MKTWNKGAIIGGIWGLLSIIPYSYASTFDNPLSEILLTIVGLPAFIAIIMNLHFFYVFIASPVIGIIIGAGMGYVIESMKDV